MNDTQQQVHAASEVLRVESTREAPQGLIVYLMRGLPSSGKSYRAKQLAASSGVVCETDRYLRQPRLLNQDAVSLDEARAANLQAFRDHIAKRTTPIVVDRGNGLNGETYDYVRLAVANDYQVRIEEPSSPWWREIRTLMRYRPATNHILECWAHELARINERTNQVDVDTILDWLDGWVADLTSDELIMNAIDVG